MAEIGRVGREAVVFGEETDHTREGGVGTDTIDFTDTTSKSDHSLALGSRTPHQSRFRSKIYTEKGLLSQSTVHSRCAFP